MIKGPNQANARFRKHMSGKPRPSGNRIPGAGSWQVSDAQRAQIQAAATQVGNALRRPETIDALKKMATKLGGLYGRK